jgi:alpha-L-fucosidase
MLFSRKGMVRLVALALFPVFLPNLGHTQKVVQPEIVYQSRTVLIAAEGQIAGMAKLIDMGPGKMGWVQSWGDKSDSITWRVRVERTGNYEVSSILESSGGNCSIAVVVDAQTLHADCGSEGWTRVRVGIAPLAAGSHTIRLNSDGSSPLRKFFSLEFERPQVREHLAALGEKEQASTSWMVAAKYGLMFHWTSQSMPRQGPPLSYCDAVRNFDVDKFANMVSVMGAGFVVFTTSHAGFYFPGPNPVIDSILPGRTCPRDLVGDLADALNRRHIRLALYFHPGHDDAPWWQRTHFDDDKEAYFKQWRAIISSIGNRYGTKLAGWWFDDAAFTYYPFNPDWEKMTAAARAGNPDRVVAYNSWILPKLNDFYDVFAGENAFWESKYEDLEYLPVGGTGRYTGGPQKGLQAEITVLINGDWGHFKKDQPISPPRFSADQIVSKLKDALSRKAVPLLDVEVYQDGTISPETFQLFQTIHQELGRSRDSTSDNLPVPVNSPAGVIARLVREAGQRQQEANNVRAPSGEDSPAVENWLSHNRASIEGTRGGPFDPTSRYVTTYSGNRIYVHILDWNGRNSVMLPSVIDRPVEKAWLLDGSTPVRVDQAPWGIAAVVPKEQRPSDIDTVVVLQMPGDPEELRLPRLVSADPARPILLLGDTAKLTGEGIHYSAGPDWIEGWTSTSDSITWRVRLPSAAQFSVAMTYSCAPGCAGAPIEISANSHEKLVATTQETQGVWQGWQAFEHVYIPGTLRLNGGVNTIEIRALHKSDTAEVLRLNSLSLISPAAQRAEQLADKRAQAIRVDTSWLRAAKYGIMVHWLPHSMPQSGPPKEYCQAVRDFDVERFADMVKQTGAGYLIFTIAQLQYFPMPMHSVDAVLSGRTCPDRDLIGDLADALQQRNIRLILYYHHGVGDTQWSKASGFLARDKSEFFRHEEAILSEIGARYGMRLSGWWFDDRYPFQPFEQLDKAAKTGNPNRLVAFNSWILPKSTNFQDYWAGEMGGDLMTLPTTGFFDDGGPESGLQPHVLIFLDDPWAHGSQDTKIVPPRHSDAQLINYIKDCNSKGAAVTMNIGVYQDGTASPETLRQLDAVRKSIRGR